MKLPMKLGSCHIAVVGRYAVEGHVPAADVLRLIKEAPDGLRRPAESLRRAGCRQGRQHARLQFLSLTQERIVMKFALPAMMASIALSTPVWAQQKADEHAGHHAASSPTPTADEMTDAEVRKVDVDTAKITLKHGDIKSLEMPAMTMVFNVRDKAMLGQVKAGDKVKFKAANEAGKLTITDLKVVR